MHRFVTSVFVALVLAVPAVELPATARPAKEADVPLHTEPPRNAYNNMASGGLAVSQSLATGLIGTSVYTRNDRKPGDVADVVDTAAGKIDQIVVELEDDSIIGETLLGIDWSEVAYDKRDDRVTLSLTYEESMKGKPARDEE